MSCCTINNCNNSDSTLTIALNVLDVVGNFAGVAVAIAFGMLQLHYWRRRHGHTHHSDEASIAVDPGVLHSELKT
jgi:DNA primase